MNFSLDFPRAHGELLGTGILRARPEDFRVTEDLGFEPSGSGEHLYLFLRKTSANTGWVGDRVAEHFGVRHFDVGYAGKKDRHAVTQQWFSVWLPAVDERQFAALDIEGVECLASTRHVKKLRRGEHVENRFELIVRDLDADASAVNARLTRISELGFPNYFGPQRFGHDGENLNQAESMFSQHCDGGGARRLKRKQRDIYLSAARSYIFNHELSQRVVEDRWCCADMGWLPGLEPHRDVVLPPVPAQFAAWAEAIRTLEVKASQRPWRVTASALNWEITDDSLHLSFGLPTGAYATSLLAELIHCENFR